MKTCPRCNRTYPDTENFCAADSSALVSAPAFTQQSQSDTGIARECPVCGGKAEPGEVICNFCGARLEGNEVPTPPPPSSRTTPQPTRISATAPPQMGGGLTQKNIPPTAQMPGGEESERRSILGLVGYILAAVIALAAGAWFALHLSSKNPAEEAAQPSPASVASSAPGAAGPIVTLATALPVQVSGPAASSPDRSADVIRKAFDDNKGTLVDSYNHALTTDPTLADGMLLRVKIKPDGTIENAAVRTSTAPNPSLDAEVGKAMLGWKLPDTSAGEVDADYPVVFAHDATEESKIEGQLQSKVASLSPSEAPEYASLPEASPVTSPAAAPSPEMAAIPPSPAVAPEAVKPHHRTPRPPVIASIPKPAPSLFQVVQDRLKANPKLRRVKAYTAGGTVTLYGRVFDESEKALAERTAKDVPGVTSVVDTLTTDEAEWADEQNRITQQLQNSGLDQVSVKVIGHDAFLSGQVKTPLEKSRAVTVAEGAAPVTVRENLIRVEPGNMFGF